MASFTVNFPGAAADATELRHRLGEVGMALGYAPRRATGLPPGTIGLMLRHIGEGLAAVLPAGSDGDFAWLAGVFESLMADNPDRAELLRSGIDACAVAERLRQRGPVGGVDRGGRFEVTEE